MQIGINFDKHSNIPVFSMWEEEDVDLNLAQRDKILADSGVKFTKDYFMKAYGFEEEDLELQEEEKIEPAKPAFKEFNQKNEFQDQQAIDEFIDSFSEDELQKQAETIFLPIIKLIRQGNSYEEIQEKLSSKGLKTDEIEQILQKAIFIAEVWGRLND